MPGGGDTYVENTELDLRQIFRIVVKRLRIIVLVTALATITAGAVSFYLLTPIYRASTTLWVIKEGSNQINLNDVMLSRNLTKTYAEVARSRAVLTDVIKRLHLQDRAVDQLQRRLTVTPLRDTEIISFSVEDPDPVMAARMADAVAESFKGQIRAYLNVQNVVVVDAAAVPDTPVRPRPLLNIAIALVLGLMAGVGIAFLLEYLDTTLKTPDDVSLCLGLPVLGTIPVIDARGPEIRNRRQSRGKQVQTVVER